MRGKKRIAFVADYIESEYSQKIYSGVRAFAAEHNLEVLVFSVGQLLDTTLSFDYQHLSVAAHLTPNNVDGIIFETGVQLNYATGDYVSSFLKSFAPLPVVSVGADIKDIHSVYCTGKVGFSALISHIIEKHGCRRIALMGARNNSTDAINREKIYKQVLLEHNIAYDSRLMMDGAFTYDMALLALNRYRDVQGRIDFDAIIAANDQMAYACVDYLRQHKIKVPEEVIVTGFDDELRSSIMSPTLSTVNQDLEKQGFESARVLFELMEGKTLPKDVTVDSVALYRQSCSCVPASDQTMNAIDQNGNRILNKDIGNFPAVGEWCLKRSQFIQVIHLYTEMQNDVNLIQFREHINSDLISLGILSAAVVLFEHPISTDRVEFFSLPPKATVYSALDRYSGFWLGNAEAPIPFNPQERLIPDGLFADMDKMQVHALYHTSTVYGYLIFRPGTYDVTVYAMVCNMFSNALSSAYNLTRSEEERADLEKEFAVATRTSVTDELTGVLNRRGFLNYGQKALEVSLANGKGGMVLFCDIDGLKKINDSYGHSAGDKVIRMEADILKKTFRQSDIIGRLGGDEFAVVAPHLSEKKFQLALRLIDDFSNQWNESSGEPYKLSLSVGAAVYNVGEIPSLETLLKKADEALYLEKQKKHAAAK
ncbi:MAG: GGDEF domain-containing protein [Treponema sp.]|nr:GGDEF domain-containing protein [Treponema sp.]MBQ2081186.1 GGDEF domain-containing protein [Treponema sp.]MEE3314109.1 GGDEF domain-containing protein [Treponema sp.]